MMEIKQDFFGKTPQGEKIYQFSLISDKIIAKVINFGAILTELHIPDKEGKCEDIVLGYDSLSDYLDDKFYFGPIIGRYANRIKNGKVIINGQEYQLKQNEGKNHLHGGFQGFHKKVWKVEDTFQKEGCGVTFSYFSPDGEENYPGNLKTKVTYLIKNGNLEIRMQAKTDKATIVNLTHHSYFNLTGAKENILRHSLEINADKFLPINKEDLPTGKIKQVKGTPMDFSSSHTIKERKDEVPHEGYNYNYILNKKPNELSFAANLYEPVSGRQMNLYTTKPGLQLYTGYLLKRILGKKENLYDKYYGICLEPQYFPDSPNHPEFPSPILNPGENYEHKIIYKFSTK